MFYALEGIDGAGCGAQRKNLEVKFKEKDLAVSTLKFPYYGSPIGEVIHEFLHGERELSVEMQFLLYASQMIDEKEKIREARKKEIIITDRYFASPLAYQGLRGFPLQSGLQFAEIFGLEIPDTTFFLDTPPQIAYARKLKEEGKEELDRNESDKKFLVDVDKKYHELMRKNVLTKWVCIDNTKTIDEVSEEIISFILKDQEKM